MPHILVLNPGSTTTKVAYFANQTLLAAETLRHPHAELSQFAYINEQLTYRTELILAWLAEQKIALKDLDGIVGRGGILRPLKAGVYEVNNLMLHRLHHPIAEHASNLGGQLAETIRLQTGNEHARAFICDPPSVDELPDVARMTGLPAYERISLSHALNMRAVCFALSAELGQNYQDLNFIVAHIGGGTTLSAHQQGRVVEIVSDDEGPMGVERVGAVPNRQLMRFVSSKGLELRDSINLLYGPEAGIFAYAGTSSMIEIEARRLAGSHQAELLFKALAYQTSKSIGSLAAALKGQVDHIILTGGVAHATYFCELVTEAVSFIAPVSLFPGEREMTALHDGCYRVLTEQEEAQRYTDEEPDSIVTRFFT